MALKEYQLGDRTYQFDEDNVPDGAVLVTKEAPAPTNKARKPANK